MDWKEGRKGGREEGGGGGQRVSRSNSCSNKCRIVTFNFRLPSVAMTTKMVSSYYVCVRVRVIFLFTCRKRVPKSSECIFVKMYYCLGAGLVKIIAFLLHSHYLALHFGCKI